MLYQMILTTKMRLMQLAVASVIYACIMTQGNCQCTETNKLSTETIIINETISTFSTPGYRVAYFPSMDCRWIFDAGRDDATIVFEIQELLIENSRRCAYDALQIYRGNSTDDVRQRSICGRLLASSSTAFIKVSGRYALLRMKSDRSRQYAGASLKLFYGVDNSGSACSGTPAAITATLTSDFITSPGYPNSLAANLDCSWTITSDLTTTIVIEIDFTDMDYTTNCVDQTLSIYDGTSSSDPALVEVWCDDRTNFPTQPTVYYTTSNNAFIQLTTSGTETSRSGFRVSFRQNSTAITTTTLAPTTTTELVQVCSSDPVILEADNTTLKYFRSANYPNYYPPNINCLWRIVAPVGYMINLTFVDSDIQESVPCTNGDYVSVYDGYTPSTRLLSTFCGAESPSLLSTGRYMYMQFKTDPTVSFRGFSALYSLESVVLPDCVISNLTGNYTASESPAYFTSPGYPDYYNSSIEVSWLIHNPNQSQAIAIDVVDSRIENSVGCVYDNVKIYQGPCTSYPVLSSFCGYDTPTIYYNTGAYALVVMTTDDSLTYKGFNISVYLTEAPGEDDSSILIVTGIIVGCVLGGILLITLMTFAVYKYLNRRRPSVTSRDSSRRSSSSSDSPRGTNSRKMKKIKDYRFQLPPIKEFRD